MRESTSLYLSRARSHDFSSMRDEREHPTLSLELACTILVVWEMREREELPAREQIGVQPTYINIYKYQYLRTYEVSNLCQE